MDYPARIKPLFAMLLCLYLIPRPATAAPAVPQVSIGVLAFNGEARTKARWEPLARHLDAAIPGYRFGIVPLTHEGFRNRIRKGKLDFILTNPAHYVRLEVDFGATRIATYRNRYRDRPLTRFGSVIFTRVDSPIRRLAKLKGRRLAAVNDEAFGGFLLARKRLLDAGIDALSELRLMWLGFPQSEIVQAVLEGHADAGTVRTGVLEEMIGDGRLQPGLIRVLGRRRAPGFPLLLSTRLYPKWAFARLPHTDEDLARQVTLTLLQIPRESAVAMATGGAGWTIPLGYSGVHAILRAFQIEPYLPRPLTLAELWRDHAGGLGLLSAAILLAGVAIAYILRINRKLQTSQRDLTRHRDQLEQLVEQRARELISTNEELKRDIESRIQYEEALHGGCECLQGIHALIVRDDLTRTQRLQSILDLLQQYFGASQALLSRVENGAPVHCIASPPLIPALAPLDPVLALQAIDTGKPVEQLRHAPDGRPQHYLACPVVRQGQVACVIELIDAIREGQVTRLDSANTLGMRILQLVAHWLAHENDAQAREAVREQAAQRLSGLTPREREVLLEVAGRPQQADCATPGHQHQDRGTAPLQPDAQAGNRKCRGIDPPRHAGRADGAGGLIPACHRAQVQRQTFRISYSIQTVETKPRVSTKAQPVITHIAAATSANQDEQAKTTSIDSDKGGFTHDDSHLGTRAGGRRGPCIRLPRPDGIREKADAGLGHDYRPFITGGKIEYGKIGHSYTADLVMYLAGNQFMVMEELIQDFQKKNPDIKKIYVETIPPGQIFKGQILKQGRSTARRRPRIPISSPALTSAT